MKPAEFNMKKIKLTTWILLAMAIGIVTGHFYHINHPAEEDCKKFAESVSILSDIFLRLIKMIIAPLVLSTLVVGIARLGDIKTLGRIGGKTMLYFISASLISLLLGMVLVNFFQPGIEMNLPHPVNATGPEIRKDALTMKEFIPHIFPKSIAEAMANNEILPIVIFSIFFGIAVSTIKEKGKIIVDFFDSVAHVMLHITSYVMKLSPFAVFGAIAGIIAQKGIGILKTYGIFVAEFYFGLIILWIALFLIAFLFVKKKTFSLFNHIKEPVILAFSTASSEAAFPKTLQQLERFGCSEKITSFVLPLGYSFNLDGSMMYMTFASLFIAQSYGIDLPFEKQVSMLLILMLTSKGVAGVPRASLVVIAATLATFNIPEAGLILLLPIDQFLDMGRSATNVVGNAVATTVVSKTEGELKNH